MGYVVLDSTIVIDVLRGRPETIGRVEELPARGDTPAVCAVTIEEVTAGLLPREQDVAAALFAGLEVAPLGMSEGRLAGYWRRHHRKRGRTLSQADCLIAASAVGLGAQLATGNPKDFPMKDLQVQHWPVSR